MLPPGAGSFYGAVSGWGTKVATEGGDDRRKVGTVLKIFNSGGRKVGTKTEGGDGSRGRWGRFSRKVGTVLGGR
jgi:hypothetical protein